MKTKIQLVSLGLTEAKADEVMLLESRMLEEAVKFSFKKKEDDSIREAEGTLVREKMILPNGELWEPKGAPRKEIPHLVSFFDLVAQGWRFFDVRNLVSVEG